MERNETERIADEIIRRYDEVYFEYMNKILDKVRGESTDLHETTPDSLAQVALKQLKLPKTP